MSLATMKVAVLLALLVMVVLMDSVSTIISACVDLVFGGLLVLVALYWPAEKTREAGDK